MTAFLARTGLLTLWLSCCWAQEALGPLSVHDVGEYGAVPWGDPGVPVEPGSRADRVRDLTFAVSSVNLSDDMTEDFLRHWADLARLGRRQGKKFLPRVYFWDGEDRYQGPMRDIEVYWQRLDRFLAAVDVKDLFGMVLAEENVHYAGRPEVLTELYRRIKAKYDVAVWQWWSPTTAVPGSGGWIPADGWVIDNYFVPREPFRRYLRKYLITGLPVVVMPWASDEWDITPQQWQDNLDQLDVAVEFNLPVAFYWVSRGTCYFPGDRNAHETPIDRWNHLVWDYIERVRAISANYTGLPSADLGQGDVLEIGPVEEDRLIYADDFSTSRCVDDATMTGFRDLVLDGRTLAARGFRGRNTAAELIYHFAGELAVQYPQVQVWAQVDPQMEGQVELGLSLDGQTWPLRTATENAPGQPLRLTSRTDDAFAQVNAFWVRVKMTGAPGTTAQPPCRIDDLRITAPVVAPADLMVLLRPSADDPRRLVYEDTFRTRKYLLVTTRAGDDKLEWSEGQLGVRLRPGGTDAHLVWHVRADQPVQDVLVEVTGQANNGSLGTDTFLEVSQDGITWTPSAGTPGRETDVNGWVTAPLVADLAGDAAYSGVKEFYVRVRMVAQGFDAVHPVVSGQVHGLRIQATVADG